MTAAAFARWCGPAALSSALGISREEAAQKILDSGFISPASRRHRRRGQGTSNIYEIGAALKRPVHLVTNPGAERLARATGTGFRRVGKAVRIHPTLSQWLSRNPVREAILRASHHFVHVKGGRVVEANGWEPRRGRVTHVIYLDT